MKVLITGAFGHVGRHLVAHYRRADHEVVTLDIPGTGAHWEIDLDMGGLVPTDLVESSFDIVICNAKVRDWSYHHLLAQRATRAIVNVGSIYGVMGPDARIYRDTEVPATPAWYAAAKGAMIAMTRYQATTLAPVRSNCVCPGGIFRDHDPLFVHKYTDRVPLQRMATEQDVVDAIDFLASDKASYITGQVLMVDGGLSAW